MRMRWDLVISSRGSTFVSGARGGAVVGDSVSGEGGRGGWVFVMVV